MSACFAVALTLSISSRAWADDERAAEATFTRAVELFRAKKYRDAAAGFDEACSLAPRGPTAYNGARAWRAAGDEPRAANDYAQALSLGGLTDALRKDATEQLSALEQKLATVQLSGPERSRAEVAGVERRLPADLHAPPGVVHVTFQTATSRDEQTISVKPGERVKVAMRSPEATTREQGRAPSESEPKSSLKTVGIASMAVGGTLLLTGIYLGVDGLATRDQFVETGRTSLSLHDRAVSQRLWANVLGIIGLGGMAVGSYLVFFHHPTPKSGSALSSLRIGLGPRAVLLEGVLP